MKLSKEHRKRFEKENRDRRSRDLDDREPENKNGDFVIQRLHDKKKSSRKVEGFAGTANASSYDDKDGLKSEFLILIEPSSVNLFYAPFFRMTSV